MAKILALSLALALSACVKPAVMVANPFLTGNHWHESGPHGSFYSEQLSEEDCETMYGGEGWE